MPPFDTHKNFAIGTIHTAPENAGDTSFVLEPGFADQFAANMPVTICPPRVQPTRDNSEIGYLTAVAGDTLTILRAQEDSIAMQVKTGWQVIGSVTAKTITDIEGAVTALDMLADALGVDVDALKLAVSSLQSGKVDKVAGKALSQNDYTDSDKARLENTSGTNTGDQDLSALATQVQLAAHTSDTNNPHEVDKADVGLDRVPNLAPADLPVSTATQTALNSKADLVDGKVPESQLPAYVDDVLTFNSLANFPPVGEDGKIYIAKDSNLTYRWTGSAYAEI